MRVLTTVFRASSIAAAQLTTEKGEPMKSKQSKRNLHIGAAFVSILVALAACQALLENRAATSGPTVLAPMFEVDPLWPKPLPNHWLLGWTIGVWVDEQDHVWVIHRGAGGLHVNEKGLEQNPPISECCRTAPPILVFDLRVRPPGRPRAGIPAGRQVREGRVLRQRDPRLRFGL